MILNDNYTKRINCISSLSLLQYHHYAISITVSFAWGWNLGIIGYAADRQSGIVSPKQMFIQYIHKLNRFPAIHHLTNVDLYNIKVVLAYGNASNGLKISYMMLINMIIVLEYFSFLNETLWSPSRMACSRHLSKRELTLKKKGA